MELVISKITRNQHTLVKQSFIYGVLFLLNFHSIVTTVLQRPNLWVGRQVSTIFVKILVLGGQMFGTNIIFIGSIFFVTEQFRLVFSRSIHRRIFWHLLSTHLQETQEFESDLKEERNYVKKCLSARRLSRLFFFFTFPPFSRSKIILIIFFFCFFPIFFKKKSQFFGFCKNFVKMSFTKN